MKYLQKFIPSVSQKVKVDSLWNVIGFGITGFNGFVLLLVISRVYDTNVLGTFNIAYAIYILVSQLAGVGIHFSVLKHTAQHIESKEEKILILNAGILLTLFVSILIMIISYFLRDLFKIFFDNPSAIKSIVLMLPALVFFTLNKVILSFHNACRHMKVYAILYTLRSILLVLCLILFVLIGVDGESLTAIFSISEFVLFCVISIYSFKYFSLNLSKGVRRWIKIHFNFGLKSLLGSVFVDVNTRVDVLILGCFLSDRWVGIYSFAGMMIEGFNQFPLVFSKIINPIISNYKFNKNKEELRQMIRKGRNLSYKYIVPGGILAVLLFPLIISVFQLNPDYINAWVPFTILMSGSLFNVGYGPFIMLLSQTGYPLSQSLLYILIFITNLLFNLILIPFFGIIGAAIATSISYVLFIFYFKILTYKKLGLKI